MEFAFSHRLSPLAVGTFAFALFATALILLCFVHGVWLFALAFALLYGWANGADDDRPRHGAWRAVRVARIRRLARAPRATAVHPEGPCARRRDAAVRRRRVAPRCAAALASGAMLALAAIGWRSERVEQTRATAVRKDIRRRGPSNRGSMPRALRHQMPAPCRSSILSTLRSLHAAFNIAHRPPFSQRRRRAPFDLRRRCRRPALDDPAAERRALVAGLLATPASIAPKYFYDAIGCALFGDDLQAARVLPDAHRSARSSIASRRDRRGGRHGQATRRSRRRRLREGRGVAAVPARRGATSPSTSRDDALERALAAARAGIPRHRRARRAHRFHARARPRAATWPTVRRRFSIPARRSAISRPRDALRFLQAIRRHCGADAESGLLIGVDTKKDPARLRAAYDDAAGVTAAFNRNMLAHVNRVIGTHFVPEAFAHVAFYNEAASRIEMHLEAIARADGDDRRHRPDVRAGERIHTENSYKYAPRRIHRRCCSAPGSPTCAAGRTTRGDFAVYYAA